MHYRRADAAGGAYFTSSLYQSSLNIPLEIAINFLQITLLNTQHASDTVV